jgi:hypothetical protein
MMQVPLANQASATASVTIETCQHPHYSHLDTLNTSLQRATTFCYRISYISGFVDSLHTTDFAMSELEASDRSSHVTFARMTPLEMGPGAVARCPLGVRSKFES